MKKTTLTLLAAVSVAGAISGPVLAQSYGAPSPADRPPADRPYGDRDHMGYGDRDHMDRGDRHDEQRGGYRADEGRSEWNIDRRINWMQERITRGRQDRSLSPREAFRVEYQLNRIRRQIGMERRMHGGRLDDGARSNLQMQIDRLNDQIRWLRHNDAARPW
jgi:hypothetical protein